MMTENGGRKVEDEGEARTSTMFPPWFMVPIREWHFVKASHGMVRTHRDELGFHSRGGHARGRRDCAGATRRRVVRWWREGRGGWLLWLRILVAAVLLFVLLNPQALLPRERTGKPKLMVVLDTSASMATRDGGPETTRLAPPCAC
jgi:hypothetical protein